MIKDKLSPALFALATLCFLLPFVTVSSNGAKVAQLSGVHVLRGETLQLPQAGDAGQQQVRIEGDPMAWFAVICVAISLMMSFVAAGGLALYPALGGLIGAGALLLMRFTLQSQIAKQANGALTKYEPGFFVAMLCLVAAAAWNFYLYSRRQPEEDILVPSSAFGTAAHFPEELPVLAALEERAPANSPVAEGYAPDETVICSNCGATLNAGARFCTACGKATEPTPVVEVTTRPVPLMDTSPPPDPPQVEEAVPAPADETLICSGCGATLNPDVRFCTVCGKPLSAEASVEAPREISRIVLADSSLPVIEPHPPPSLVTDIVCSNCGAALNPASKFCNMCGTPVGTTVAIANVPEELSSPSVDPVITRQQDDYALVQEGAKTEYRPYDSGIRTGVLDTPRRTKKGLPLVGIAVLLLVLILGSAAGWYFWGVDTVVACSPFDAKASLDGVELAPDTPGRFSIPHLSRGPHTLKVQRDGYDPTVQTLDFPVTSISEYVNVRLSPQQKANRAR